MLMIRMLWKGTLWHKYNNKKYWKHLMQLISDLTNEKKGQRRQNNHPFFRIAHMFVS